MKTKKKNGVKKPEKKSKEVKKEIPKKESPKDEEEIKDAGTLSDGVLDAFEETAPAVDPLLEEEALLESEDNEDEDTLDYNPAEW